MLLNATNKSYESLNLILKGKGKINFYQLFPLYKEELEHKLETDVGALLELFDDNDLTPVVNIERKNYGMVRQFPKQTLFPGHSLCPGSDATSTLRSLLSAALSLLERLEFFHAGGGGLAVGFSIDKYITASSFLRLSRTKSSIREKIMSVVFSYLF